MMQLHSGWYVLQKAMWMEKKAELWDSGLQIKAQRMQTLISMDAFAAPLGKRN